MVYDRKRGQCLYRAEPMKDLGEIYSLKDAMLYIQDVRQSLIFRKEKRTIISNDLEEIEDKIFHIRKALEKKYGVGL